MQLATACILFRLMIPLQVLRFVFAPLTTRYTLYVEAAVSPPSPVQLV